MAADCVVAHPFHGKTHFYDAREPAWVPDVESASRFTRERAGVVAAEIGGVVMVLGQRRVVDGQLRPGLENDHARKA